MCRFSAVSVAQFCEVQIIICLGWVWGFCGFIGKEFFVGYYILCLFLFGILLLQVTNQVCCTGI